MVIMARPETRHGNENTNSRPGIAIDFQYANLSNPIDIRVRVVISQATDTIDCSITRGVRDRVDYVLQRRSYHFKLVLVGGVSILIHSYFSRMEQCVLTSDYRNHGHTNLLRGDQSIVHYPGH